MFSISNVELKLATETCMDAPRVALSCPTDWQDWQIAVVESETGTITDIIAFLCDLRQIAVSQRFIKVD